MKRLIFVAMALLLMPALSLASIPHTMDKDGPTHGVQKLQLRELWRAGGTDEEVIFGRITDFKLHPDGCLYVLDNQLCQVMVFSPEGEHLRDLSRQGDGPGELRQPTGIVFLGDDVLGVGLGFPAKLVTMKLDGTPIDTCYPAGAPADGNVAVMISLRYVDGVLAASGGSIVFGADGQGHTDRFLSVGDTSFENFYRILEKETPVDPVGRVFVEAENYYIDRSWDLGTGGRFYAPMKRDAYEISEFDRKGQLVRVFGRQYAPRKRTSEDKERISPLINTGNGDQSNWKIESHDECISRIMVHPDNENIWVLTPHGHEEQPEGILETWDVFSPTGEYLKQVVVPLGNEMIEGTCFLIGDNKMLVVRGTQSSFDDSYDTEIIEVEPLELIVYEMP